VPTTPGRSIAALFSDGQPLPDATIWRLARWCVAALALVMLAGFILATARPLSYDPFYTYYQGRPDWTFTEALTDHWLKDNHPPLYYALVHLAERVTRHTSWLSGVNLAAAALASAGVVTIVRNARQLRLPAALLMMALLSSLRFVNDLTYLRSYSLQASADVVILTGLIAILTGSRLGRLPGAVVFGAIVVGLNLHVQNTLSLLILLALAVAACCWQRNRTGAILIVTAGGVGLAIFAGFALLQLPYWNGNTASVADRTWADALALLGANARQILLPNGLLLGFATWGAIRLWRDRFRRDAIKAVTFVLGGSLCLTCTALAAIDPVMLSPKYLVLVQIEVLFAAALVAGWTLPTLRPAWAKGFLVLLAVMAGVQCLRHSQTAALPLEQSWETPAFMAALARQCGGQPVVHVLTLPRHFYNPISGPDAAEVTPAYIRLMAAEQGYRLEPAGSRQLDPACPTVFWILDTLRPEWTADYRARVLLEELHRQGFAVRTIEQVFPEEDFIVLGR
jgi:hypothetical protein